MSEEKEETISATLVVGDLKDCCRKVENLERVEMGPGAWKHVCKVCGCNHYGMLAEPAPLSKARFFG